MKKCKSNFLELRHVIDATGVNTWFWSGVKYWRPRYGLGRPDRKESNQRCAVNQFQRSTIGSRLRGMSHPRPHRPLYALRRPLARFLTRFLSLPVEKTALFVIPNCRPPSKTLEDDLRN